MSAVLAMQNQPARGAANHNDDLVLEQHRQSEKLT
jgi:hypothetical protein